MTMLIRSGLKDSFSDERFVTDEMVKRYTILSRAPNRRAAILKMMSDSEARRDATTELMSQISVPTLILHGDQDNLVPVDGGRKFGETIEGAVTVIYENVGHLPQEEVTRQSLTDLRDFLATLVEPASLEDEAAELTNQLVTATTTD